MYSISAYEVFLSDYVMSTLYVHSPSNLKITRSDLLSFQVKVKVQWNHSKHYGRVC